MPKGNAITLVLAALALIFSYLNIQVWSSADTVNAIWNFIYPFDHEFMGLTIASYLALVLLLVSPFLQGKRSFYFSLVGLLLLWVNVLSFYPQYFIGQREHLFNAQYLFVTLTVLIVALQVKKGIRNPK